MALLSPTLNTARALMFAAAGLAVTGSAASAQEPLRYRNYVLESSLDAVIAVSGVRAADAKTLHERPARIQELQWRAPYVYTGSAQADPVQQMAFAFVDDRLYRVLVTYDRDRTEGLTNADIIKSLSTTYGAPIAAPARSRASAEAPPGTIVLAKWENAASSLTLVRGVYSPEYQLVLSSTALSALARKAVSDAVRLDALEAPRRELEQRRKDAAEATADRDSTRTTNKDAFRP